MASKQRDKAFAEWKVDLEERLAMFLFEYFDADNPAKSFEGTEHIVWIIKHQNAK